MLIDDVVRLRLATFIRPASESATGRSEVEGVYAYLIRHDDGLLLLDTGMGRGDDETEQWYRPQRSPLTAALAAWGATPADIRIVVNCHLHFDHCGENPLFLGTPIIAQRGELAVARQPDYTFDHLVDFTGARYELLDGEAEISPGVHVIPTPGHVNGHQSLVIQCSDGSLVLAGQSHDRASAFSADALAQNARQLGHDDPLPLAPPWMQRLMAFDPRRVYFAHDAAVWEPY
ncbi:glyoxylase-like metal-dependent hydrolase (beta-lactamase superfamily II) [Jatrophihabitans sp. GAS493]|uniref:N-acyl homoserine lactonase family protein n=1 Tax=Jatrophihabitans sp. GAS493 TaxID=1907575 RepID=UPI000BB802A8|nr:N-acyl homoserine lactonase family protein [Jatrophihabitans sp. GAS493]SOD70922.1 glyoxylase-like metal-dependent hydrolase (beta-lactamase superfamily II) [Jatrophihabitans sp. GAS493]